MSPKYYLPLFALLVSLSFLVHHLVPPYLPVGEQLLANTTFSQDGQAWEKRYKPSTGGITIQPNQVTLSTYSQPTSLQLFQTIDAKLLNKYVLFQASAKGLNIIPGKHSWNKGRILLVQYVNQKPVYSEPHHLTALEGSTGWEKYTRLFTLDLKTEYISINLQLSHATGKLQCKYLTLYNAVPNPLYAKLRILIMGVWGLFCLALFSHYLQHTRFLTRLALLFTILTLLFGVTMSATLKNDLKNQINHEIEHTAQNAQQQLQHMQNWMYRKAETASQASRNASSAADKQAPPTNNESSFHITKLAHLLLFMVLGMLLQRTGSKPTRQIVLDLLLLACITETLQLFIPGRSALWVDVGIDLSGGLTGIFFFQIFLQRNIMKGVEEQCKE